MSHSSHFKRLRRRIRHMVLTFSLFILSVVGLSELGARLGLVENNVSNPQTESGLLKYESPSIQSFSHIFIADAAAC